MHPQLLSKIIVMSKYFTCPAEAAPPGTEITGTESQAGVSSVGFSFSASKMGWDCLLAESLQPLEQLTCAGAACSPPSWPL